jgi:hypothetical protein
MGLGDFQLILEVEWVVNVIVIILRGVLCNTITPNELI